MADAFTSDTYNALCSEAEEYLSRGLVEQAREHLLKAVSLIGTRPRARSLLADCCMALGLWSEAREQLEQLTTLEINNAQNHYRLGQVLEELGEYELARDNYQVVVDFEPSNRSATVAIGRLAGKVPGASRPAQQEKPRNTPPAPKRTDVQIFPDVPNAEDVFATTEDLDNLLKDIGVAPGAGKDSDGEVSALLSKVGINLEPPKKTEPVIEKPPVRDVSDVLGTGHAPQGGLEALFNPEAGPAGAAPPATPEMPEQNEFSLESIFHGAPGKEAAPPPAPAAAPAAPAAPPAPPAASEAPPESLDALFGIAEEVPQAPPAPVEAAPPVPPPAVSLDDVFSTGEKAGAPAESLSLETVFEADRDVPPAPPGPQASPVEPLAAPMDLRAVPAEPHAAPAEPTVAVEPLALESVFEAAEPSMTQAIAPEKPVEAPAGIESVLESVFPSMQADATADVSRAEPGPSLPPVAPTVPEVPPAGPPVLEAAFEAAGPATVEAGTEPPAEEPQPAAPEAPPEPALPAGPAPASYVVHKPGPDELLALHLGSGELEVRLSFVVATEEGLSVREEGSRRLLGGSGVVLLGQGSRTPVVVALEAGCLVRADRLAAFDSSLVLDEGGAGGLPGLSRVESGSCSAVLFATGRTREVRAGEHPLKVRAACLLAAEAGVAAAPDPENPDFAVLTGNGRAILAL